MSSHYSAPGKMFVSGEWAILEMGKKGLVAAVNRRVHARVEPAERIAVSIEDFALRNMHATFDGKKLFFEKPGHEKETQFIKESIETALRFLEEKGTRHRNFSITTWGEDTVVETETGRKKIGFGSSAAATVAVVSSILDFHGYKATKEEVYKLATIAHYFAQGKVGSAFDVAASTYGGLFVYSRFDPAWLTRKIEKGEISDIVGERWPGFVVEELPIPNDFHLLIGWTGEEASTPAMIKQMNEFKSKVTSNYYMHMGEIGMCAERAIDAWKNNDRNEFLDALRSNESELAALGFVSGVNIETPGLKKLSEAANRHGAAGKLSGAGGGDCGIAVCFDHAVAKKVQEEWERADIRIVDAKIDREGIRKER